MKDFQRKGGRLRTLPFEARLVYTVFLAFTLVAFALTAVLYDDMVGLDAGRVLETYAGHAPADFAEPEIEGGPTLDLPEFEAAEPTPMSQRKLLEVTHFHLFSMPVYLLILSHLYMLSKATRRRKALWIITASLSTAAHAAAPWMVAHGLAAGLYYGLSGAVMTLSYLVMCIVPLWEMWTPLPDKSQ